MSNDSLQRAREAMANAYAPYSGFAVGAVVEGANGKLYSGCNVENAAYPESICAEAAAIAAMIADGQRHITAVTLMAAGHTSGTLISPCGGCRQRLREFAAETTPVHLCCPERVVKTLTLGELLPQAFGPDNLAARAKS